MNDKTKDGAEKQKFIGEYLDRKMKGHGLSMSMEYYSLLHKTEIAAEIAWERKQRKLTQNQGKL